MPFFELSTFLPQIFWLLVSFTILYFLLAKVCLPKVFKVFIAREEAINTSILKAKEYHAEATKLREEYQQKLLESLKYRDDILSNLSSELNKEADKKHQEIEAEISNAIDRFEKEIKEFEINNKDKIKLLAKETAQEVLNCLFKSQVSQEQVESLFNSIERK